MDFPRTNRARQRRLWFGLVLATIAVGSASAQESVFAQTGLPLNVWLTLAGIATSPRSYDQEGAGLSWESEHFILRMDGVLNNDQKYFPSEPHMRGRYFELRDGSVKALLGDFGIAAGRIVHTDEVFGPYSLFISSMDRPTTAIDVRFDNGFFFYDTRWLELNRQSSLYTYPVPVLDPDGLPTGDYVERPLDRGANYKVYGLDFGNLRVGLQESVVYLYKTFYPEYFLSPLPMYFTQLVNSTSGKPWTQMANENAIMGFFVDYAWDNTSVFFQFLLDDASDFGIEWLGVGTFNQPTKFGWSLGGTMETAVGTFGLYHAGASKYTFEPTYADGENFNRYPYSYTYFPVTEYYTPNFGWKPILPEDNYIGYMHGENNIAFQGVFSSEVWGAEYDASLEYTISGSKSPSNPWHDADWHPGQGTALLDDDRLEHKLVLNAQAHRWFGPLRVAGHVELGEVWNELQLREVDGAPDESKIFTPSDTNRFLWEVGLEIRYSFGFGDPRTTDQ